MKAKTILEYNPKHDPTPNKFYVSFSQHVAVNRGTAQYISLAHQYLLSLVVLKAQQFYRFGLIGSLRGF